jgi:tetratricopeptide (TPR) repeat protein
VRRAAACQRSAALRADWWLRLACAAAPRFTESHRALVHLRRIREDRWGAVAAARDAIDRFPAAADAWLLLGEAYQMVYRQAEALAAYEQVLVLEERPDAAMAAGEIYWRSGRYADAASRFARAYAAGGGADALWRNAQALLLAGDETAADDALTLWATQVPDGHERLAAARAELRGKTEEDGGRRRKSEEES